MTLAERKEWMIKTRALGHECRSSCCRVYKEKGQGSVQPSLQERIPTPGMQRWPSTYDLSFSTPKVQKKETRAII